MSIAQAQKIKELEAKVAALQALVEWNAIAQNKLLERLTALENRPKPGRPPKNG